MPKIYYHDNFKIEVVKHYKMHRNIGATLEKYGIARAHARGIEDAKGNPRSGEQGSRAKKSKRCHRTTPCHEAERSCKEGRGRY